VIIKKEFESTCKKVGDYGRPENHTVLSAGTKLQVQETLQKLMAPTLPPRNGFYDEVVKKRWCFHSVFLDPVLRIHLAIPALLVHLEPEGLLDLLIRKMELAMLT
jgi:hypothetical protein